MSQNSGFPRFFGRLRAVKRRRVSSAGRFASACCAEKSIFCSFVPHELPPSIPRFPIASAMLPELDIAIILMWIVRLDLYNWFLDCTSAQRSYLLSRTVEAVSTLTDSRYHLPH